MATASSSLAASPLLGPVYAVAAICGLVTSSVTALVARGIKSGTSAATMPALAAAGLVWQTKSLLSKDQSPSLCAQPSILNWHDLPAQE